jgi:hypothetical protein
MEKLRNPNANKFILPKGYKDLGWQKHSGNCEEVKSCCDKGHNDMRNNEHQREFDISLFQFRCTDVVKICDYCKIVWHIDMS